MAQNKTPKQLLQKYRVPISRVLLILLLAYLFGVERIAIWSLDSAVGLAGALIVVLGVAIRSFSAGVLHKNRELATEGIYALARNPLYLGSLVMLVGVNLIIWNVWVLLVSVGVFALTYIPTIRSEERGLARQFGPSWEAYAASTPRLLPKLSRLGALRGVQWSGAQWRKNHEHNTLIAAVVILALLQAYAVYLAGG